MIRIAQISLLIFPLVLAVGCKKQSANVLQQTPLTPVAQEIERRGYQVKESGVVEPSDWERSTFQMRSKKSFSFQATQPLPNARDTYCRFKLIEETFDSDADAQDRLAKIHLPDPAGPAEEQHYLSAMRTGFRIGSVAYIFQTDGSIFWDEVQRLAKELSPSAPSWKENL